MLQATRLFLIFAALSTQIWHQQQHVSPYSIIKMTKWPKTIAALKSAFNQAIRKDPLLLLWMAIPKVPALIHLRFSAGIPRLE
ncbi:hypothetical protein BTJ40_16165 [Microbulbifer sp. A4B17]|nr:hypothetical protein BTJ40_16165 [Microbulbifer sp. A4B17]